MIDLKTLTVLMLAVAAAYAWWNSARAAAELAGELGREACASAGVIWLDQSVHANGIRWRRGRDGRFGFERSFRFEYSYDGIERHIGRLVLRGDELVQFSGPVRAAPVFPSLP